MTTFNDDEVLAGYSDGFDLDNPAPSANRSASYRHGFANGRDDRRGRARASARVLRVQLAEARALDAGA